MHCMLQYLLCMNNLVILIGCKTAIVYSACVYTCCICVHGYRHMYVDLRTPTLPEVKGECGHMYIGIFPFNSLTT